VFEHALHDNNGVRKKKAHAMRCGALRLLALTAGRGRALELRQSGG